ncbi:hypothetical protein DJ021_06995 [Phenylobacterium hankyongense]|uniref:Uncharacterized protein n=1 Tax=Phenylobacterium hankyongense TaxID=1813876 RepID=A0A328AZ44_9CAUL|nr:hypothetical protein [Phenylobacterium hankyongense]RAK59565.1 hypothetical protein DJ021_06995 [Phenylobacterium hankyongense]
MLFEYAVEPRAIGSSWETFRYIIELFGFDRGRLISQFPKAWLREVYDATAGFSPVQKKKVEVALDQARRAKLVRSGRTYDAAAANWLEAALTSNSETPFRAIIALENPAKAPEVLVPDDLDEGHALMLAPRDAAVPRDVASIVGALREFLRFGSRILFVDAFYDPYNARYRSVIRECLKVVKEFNPAAVCEFHYRYHANKPAQADLEREAKQLFAGDIPEGMSIRIFCWKQRNGGEDFHARYLLTDRGGMQVDGGFSAEGAEQTTNMNLLSLELAQLRLNALSVDATDYELMVPVLKITADCSVEHAE